MIVDTLGENFQKGRKSQCGKASSRIYDAIGTLRKEMEFGLLRNEMVCSRRNRIFTAQYCVNRIEFLASQCFMEAETLWALVLNPKPEAELGVFMYTIQRERGGPYRKINEEFQADDLVCDKFEIGAEIVGMSQQKMLEYSRFLTQDPFLFPFDFKVLEDRKYLSGEVEMVTASFEKLYNSRWSENLAVLPGKFWRGMDNLSDDQFEQFQPGVKFFWPSFVSTSEKRSVAVNFCREDVDNPESQIKPESALFRIWLQENAGALSISSVSQYADEEEVLLYPYHKFEVTSVIQDHNLFQGRAIINLLCLGAELKLKLVTDT